MIQDPVAAWSVLIAIALLVVTPFLAFLKRER